MSIQINRHELQAVTSLAADARYAYFLKKVVDWEEVWGIGDEKGWAFMTDGAIELVPVWPAEAFAAACCVGEWQSKRPNAIDLDTWLEKWIPGIIRDNRQITVFPIATDTGNKRVVVTGERLNVDLVEALEAG